MRENHIFKIKFHFNGYTLSALFLLAPYKGLGGSRQSWVGVHPSAPMAAAQDKYTWNV